MDKVLSISIACYNVEDYLQETLLPFLNTRNMDYLEVLINDDAATDNSLAIARKFEKQRPEVFKVTHEKVNGNWGKAQNSNIEKATGKYFKILDGDDYLEADALDELIEFLKDADEDIVLSGYATFLDGQVGIKDIYPVDPNKFKGGNIIEGVSVGIPLAMHSFTVKTSLLKENNIHLKEKCLYRDMEYTSKVLLYAKTIKAFDKPVYYYRLGRNGQSISMASYLKHIDEHASIVYDILSISKMCTSEKKKELLYDLANGADVQQYRIYFCKTPVSEAKREANIYDKYIKNHYPEYYQKRKLPRIIRILVGTRFISFRLLVRLGKIKRKIANQKTE